MNAATDRRAVLRAILTGAACLSAPSLAAIPASHDVRVAALAQRIAALLREQKANEKALEAVSADQEEPLLAKQKRIQAEMDAAFREVLDISGMSNIELTRALMEVSFGAGPKQAPAFIRTFVEALAAA
jgi:hypothetical protein